MSENPLSLAVIIGSTRQGRFGPTLATWIAGEAARHDDVTVDLIDLAEDLLQNPPAAAQSAVPEPIALRLARADAFIVVTPEYNHSFPAPLKQAIDAHFHEWRAKPIGFVSYGGIGGGLRAVEQLRQIFPELHAMTVRDVVSFHMAWEQIDADGRPKDASRYERAAKKMLDQISWWGRALREGRAARPYVA